MTDYDKIDALNWSTLKHMDVTPAYARHLYDHPEEQADKPAYISGRVVHCVVLEPDTFDARYIVEPEFCDCAVVGSYGDIELQIIKQPQFGDLRYKESKNLKKRWIESLPHGARALKASQAKAEWLLAIPDGAQIISQNDYDMALRCAAKVKSDDNAQVLMRNADFEKIVQWKMSGIDCKGRMDILSDRVIDLKFTRHDNLHDIYRDFALFNYHGQLTWYHDGAVKAGLIDGQIPPSSIVVHASHKSTFTDSFVMDMDNYTMEYGRAKYQTLLNKYVGCHTTNWWPGMATQPVPWVLPEWKMKADYEEMEE